MDTKDKTTISLMYVAKNLKKNPTKALKYIKLNRQMFKWISDEQLKEIMKEHEIRENDIELAEEEIIFNSN